MRSGLLTRKLKFMDKLDRTIVDSLQDGIAVCDRPFAADQESTVTHSPERSDSDFVVRRTGMVGPFAALAESLSISEQALLARVKRMLDEGVLTRFGPMYQAERLGGALTLCAMKVPESRFDAITDIVNGFTEVAHNYRREHVFNMWFVLATETPQAIETTRAAIEEATGCEVFNMPKLQEFYVQLRLSA